MVRYAVGAGQTQRPAGPESASIYAYYLAVLLTSGAVTLSETRLNRKLFDQARGTQLGHVEPA